MKTLNRLLLAVGLFGVIGCAPVAPPLVAREAAVRDVARLRAHVEYLADPAREGRGVGTDGLDQAANYIAEQFKSAGLRTLNGWNGYFQAFDLPASTRVEPSTTMSLGGRALRLGHDFMPAGFSATGPFSAPVVFAGYGMVHPEHGYDDYAGLDVSGKAVLVMRFEPHTASGKSRLTDQGEWSPEAALHRKAHVAAHRGASAILVVTPPKHHGATDALLPAARMAADERSRIPVIQITRRLADDILAQSGVPSLVELQTRIDRELRPQSRALRGVSVAGNIALRQEAIPVRNVVGLLPGEGPLAGEYVVVGAHYDHLGLGERGSLFGYGMIHPGADDNASGVSVLIEVAHRLSEQPRGRSVVFAAFTAEEIGLIGSARFVDQPPIPIERIIAMVNLDMVGRLRNNILYIGGSGTAREFGTILDATLADVGLKMRTIGRGGFGPSDHASFAARRIPVLFLFTGLHADYHRPTDTADKLNYDGLARIARFTHMLVRRLRHIDRPAYIADDDSP